jgi:hypothetical protein
MTGLFVKPCCRASSVRTRSLSIAGDAFYFVPVIAAKCWLLLLLMLMLVLFSFHPQFPPSPRRPTPPPIFPAPACPRSHGQVKVNDNSDRCLLIQDERQRRHCCSALKQEQCGHQIQPGVSFEAKGR